MNTGIDIGINSNFLTFLVSKLSSNHYKDKNEMCVILYLISKTMQGWYNEIVSAYSPFTAAFFNNRRIDVEMSTRFLTFAQSRNYSPAILLSIEFLDRAKTKFEKGELRKIVDRLDIDKLSQIRTNLHDFFIKVFGTEIITSEILKSGVGTKQNAEAIQEWIKILDDLREGVRKNISHIHMCLDCNQEMLDNLISRNQTT